MDRKDQPAASAGRRDRAPMPGAPAQHRGRKPALLGFVVAAGAMGAWLLRRGRPQPPEGTWRDLLSSDVSGGKGDVR